MLTKEQKEKIKWLCKRYKTEPDYDNFVPKFDLPDGWVAGWVGKKVYIGISPEGDSHS